MAWEIYPENRGYVLVGTEMETTYGTEPTMNKDDVLYVDSFEGKWTPITEKKEGMTPYRTGFPPVVTGADLSWSAGGEFAVQAIADPPIAGNSPKADPMLRLCSFQRLLGGANQNSITYFLRSHGYESSTIYGLLTNSAADNENRMRIRGARGSMKIILEAGTKARWEAEGMGIPQATPDDTWASTAAAPLAVVYPKLPTVVAQGGTIKLVDDSGPTVYGGGTVAAPENNALILSCNIDCKMNLQKQGGLSAALGFGRAMPNPLDPVAIALVLEMTDADEWNPYALWRAEKSWEINMVFPCASNTSRTMQAVTYAHIVNVAKGAGGGRRSFAVDLEAAWPDGVNNIGTDPAQYPNAVAANRGLAEDPGVGTPVASVLALQFDAAA